MHAEVHDIGFDVGKEGFMQFFWESGNPLAIDRQSSFKGDLGKVRIEMEREQDITICCFGPGTATRVGCLIESDDR